MELMETRGNHLIDTVERSDVNYQLGTTSPRSLAQRRQIPLRSLENTDLSENNTNNGVKPVIMVCSETVNESPHRIVHTRESLPSSTLNQDSNSVVDSCPAISSQTNHSCQKSLFRNGNQTLTSTPNGLNHKMVRSTNCHVSRSPQCILKSGENLKTDKSESASWVRIRTDPFTEHYTVEEEIGRGKFAVVKRCCHKATGRRYAAKFLRKRRKGKDCRAEALKEVQMLEMAIIHPRMVDMIEVFETTHEIIIIMEYAAGGELFHRVVEDENYDEQETRRLLRQVLEAVLFLHERHIVHLDIKPQNILLTDTGYPTNVKLCDLGFARHIHSGDDIRDIIGTPDYVAPEILSYEPIHVGSDMWSIGVLSYVLLTGCSPFAGDTKQETFLNISQVNLDFPAELFGHISQAAVDFISKLLVRSPDERLTARECLNHPWIRTAASTPTGSPIGQRRALTPPSPGTLAEEPLKKCRCDISSPSPTPSTSCSHSCGSCDTSNESCDTNSDDSKVAMTLSFDDTDKSSCDKNDTDINTDTPNEVVTEKCSLQTELSETTCSSSSLPPEGSDLPPSDDSL